MYEYVIFVWSLSKELQDRPKRFNPQNKQHKTAK